jgi:DNA-binding MarR family transcriptional regulator
MMYLHIQHLPGTLAADSMRSMSRPDTSQTTGRARERLSPCVCNTLRMVSRTVTQLYDDILRPSGLRVTQYSILATLARMGEANLRQLEDALAIDQTTLTRSLGLLERRGVIERVPHPDGRIKAMRLTSKGRRVLTVARPLWVQAQNRVLRELGPKAWADAQQRLAHLLSVAVRKRRAMRGGSRVHQSRAQRRGSLMAG